MDKYQPQLGELLRSHRAQRSYSQEALAKAAGVDVRTVRSVEKGKAILETKLGPICAALGLGVSDVADLKTQALNLQRASEVAPRTASIERKKGGAAFHDISTDLDSIDDKVAGAFGKLRAPTRSDGLMRFSCRRLISSLSSLGIPLEIILLILAELPEELHRSVSGDSFSTSHIRSAVARIISGLSTATIQASESYKFRQKLAAEDDKRAAITAHEIKFDWASRYARRYGSADQAIQVLERDGSSRILNYSFLREELIPHVMRRILGKDFDIDSTKLVNRSVIEEMSRSTLEEFKRIGLYAIRYRTALLLVEDLAIHPPHPWMVTQETRVMTIAYDFERAAANLKGLESGAATSGFDTNYRYSEVLHHLCSAILAIYSGFLGHRDTSSIQLLRHWLKMDESNLTLWRTCDLRLIDSDLAQIGLDKADFNALLKRMAMADQGSNRKSPMELAESGRRLFKIAQDLNKVRALMSALNTEFIPGTKSPHHVFEAIARETLVACLGCKRVRELTDASSGASIGLLGVLKFDKTMLGNQLGLTIFLFCHDSSDSSEISVVIERAIAQLELRDLAKTCIILCSADPSDALKRAARSASARLDKRPLICAASIPVIRDTMKAGASVEDIIDDILDG